MFKKIANIANWLDSIGLHKEADSMESMLLRLADDSGIIGQYNAGDYLKDFGEGAAMGAGAGAAGGALATIPAGGAGAIPGAIIGGIGGAVGNGVTDIAKNLWYNTRSDGDKASWQAGDAQTKIGKICDIASKIEDPNVQSLVQQIQNYATEYKNFIDFFIQGRQDADVSNNVFMQNPARTTNQNTQNLNPTSSRNHLKRVYSDYNYNDAPPVDDTDLSDLQHPVGDLATNFIGNYAGEEAAKKGIAHGIGNLGTDAISYAESNPLKLLSTSVSDGIGGGIGGWALGGLAAGGALAGGLAGGIVADTAYNATADEINHIATGSDANLVAQQLQDVKQQIALVNNLSKNDQAVVHAGDELWGVLIQLYRAVGGGN